MYFQDPLKNRPGFNRETLLRPVNFLFFSFVSLCTEQSRSIESPVFKIQIPIEKKPLLSQNQQPLNPVSMKHKA
jgi:hypothetical protein